MKPAGLAWLDRAKPSVDIVAAAGASVLAADPVETWVGRTEGDWLGFSDAWGERSANEPGAVAIGWVEYGGDFCFAIYGQPAFYDHPVIRGPDGGGGSWRFPAGEPSWWVETVARATSAGPAGVGTEVTPGLCFRPEVREIEYCERVRRAQERIAAGDIYQVNLSHRVVAAWPGDASAFALYERLREVSPAPEAAFLAFPGRTVLCTSPELFLNFDGRHVRTRPIKGTRPRGTNPDSDAAAAQALLTSSKERAELLMITDLLRNDLGGICPYGEVRVPELLRIERLAQVFHLVSTVEGRLRPEVTHPMALRACLPGGSITGAPKRRAREIIAKLESPTPRGLYTGSLGIFSAAGWSRFNIVIRTLIVEAGEAHFHVGAGIVADSEPASEYQETLHKAAGILRAATGNPRLS